MKFLTFLAVAGFVGACTSTNDGEGFVKGAVDVPECWTGPFDLHPDFFGAAPYRETLEIRLQRGSDFQTYSDGVSILVRDTTQIRNKRYDVDLPVGLSPDVVPPGFPVVPSASPPLVSLAFYLQRTCKTRNVALYAVDTALLAADGTCGERPIEKEVCSSDAGANSSASTARSTIRFSHLPSDDPNESDASLRLIEGTFDVYVADPRDLCRPGPPPCRGHLRGGFRFYFQRGRPAQPFP